MLLYANIVFNCLFYVDTEKVTKFFVLQHYKNLKTQIFIDSFFNRFLKILKKLVEYWMLLGSRFHKRLTHKSYRTSAIGYCICRRQK